MKWKSRIKFVKAVPDNEIQGYSQPPSFQSQTDWGQIYRGITLPDHNSRDVVASNNEVVAFAKCAICGVELPSDEDARKAHSSSLVHQLGMGASSRAPSAVNRRSKGFKIMTRHGYDPDEDTGLGVEGSGLKKPIEIKERNKGAALGSTDPYKKRAKAEDAAKIVKKTKGEKRQAHKEAVEADSRKHKAWYDELYGK